MKKFKQFEVQIENVTGPCAYSYQKGQKFKLTGLKTIDGMCGAVYHAIFPSLFTLNFNGKFKHEDKFLAEDTIACPDNGFVTVKIKIIGEIEAESILDA